MRNVVGYRTRKQSADPNDLTAALAAKVVGQSAAVSSIVPYVQMYQAGLAPEGRPVGVFLLLGPSGTGKTRTVEALASVLHGNEKNVLRIDCGEYQMEHEVAKLIGAPPGYLGHRETQPMLTQTKLNAVTSERSSLSLLLLDEIEKAAPSMARLLLGVLDKASLRLGDNNTVNFERTMIFMTSNLGANEMLRALRPDFGFQAMTRPDSEDAASAVERIGMNSVRRRFAPEFVNRIDSVITYRPLEVASLEAILDQQLAGLQAHINGRLGQRGFPLELSDAARSFLLQRGTSAQYGARELKRTIHRNVIQPLAAMVANGLIEPAEPVYVEVDESGERLVISTEPPAPRSKRPRAA
jgi:ATP-dependent Clp protease ATP-binding subunit ClpA